MSVPRIRATLRPVLCAFLLLLACVPALAQKTIHVPADAATIQAGIDAASTGDTVLVSPGTWYENLSITGKEITLKSSDGALKTILDGGRKGRVIDFLSTFGTASVIDGFTIRNGQSPYTPAYSGIHLNLSGATIQNNIIAHNYGVGIAAEVSTVNVINNQIDTSDPGGFCQGTAGIFLFGNLQVPLASGNYVPSIVRGNTIDGGSDPCAGGGLLGLAVFNAVIENNVIRNSWYGMELYIVKANIRQNLIYGNRTYGLYLYNANGIYPLTDPADIFITNNTIANNLTMPGPDSPKTYGEFVLDQVYARMSVSNNIIAANSSTSPAFACSLLLTYQNDTPVILDHNDIVNTNPAPYPFEPMNCSDDNASTEIGLNGNISSDPRFTGSTDFHLLPNSPAIDSGNNSAYALPAADYEGKPRITDATGLGYPRVDMGIYEAVGTALIPTTTLSLTSSTYFVQPNQVITLTATPGSATGAPVGSISMYQDDKLIDTQAVSAGGVTTRTVGGLPPGLYRFTATYSPVGPYAPAISTVIYIRVQRYTPILKITSSPNPSVLGQIVTFNTHITSPDTNQLAPVTVLDVSTGSLLATLTPDSSGDASFNTSALNLGSHTIQAFYAGDKTHYPATSQLIQQVLSGYATTTTLSATPNPALVGATVTFTATVTSLNGSPTGSVQFASQGNSLGSAVVDATGHATLSTSTLSIGIHQITAVYQPDGSFATSNAALSEVIQAITNTVGLTSSANPSEYGAPITLIAVVASNSSTAGLVTFYNGSNVLGQTATTAANGVTSLVVPGSALTTGANTLRVVFAPTNGSTTATASLTQTVNGLPSVTTLTASPNSGVAYANNITLTATVSPATPGGPTPGGSVLFYGNSGQLSFASVVNGVATLTVTLPTGTNHMYAVYYPGTGSIYKASTSNTADVTITAAPSTLTLTSSGNPSFAFQPVTFAAQLLVNGQPATSGLAVQFTVISSTLAVVTTVSGITNASGIATFTTSALPAGTYAVSAVFVGDTSVLPASQSLTQQVMPLVTATSLSITPNPAYENQAVTFNLRVSTALAAPGASGTITLFDTASPAQPLTYAVTQGSLTFTLNNLPVGTHTMTATFAPADASYTSSTSSPVTLIIVPQSFTVTLSDDHPSIVTGHHRSVTVSINSIGGLTAPFTLACGTNLPQWTSCQWGQSSLTLPANGTVSTSLTIDTNQLPGFLASSVSTQSPAFWNIRFAALPVLLLAFYRRRNLRAKLPRLLMLFVFFATASIITACGANKYPYSTAPGTYSIPVVVTEHPTTAGSSAITKTIYVTLDVTN